MEKQFTYQEMESFGEYLLSPERTESIINHPDAANMAPVEERLKKVHDIDIENWKEKIGRFDFH